VPELPGCVSDWKTRREALTNVKEAISGYLETLKDMNWAMSVFFKTIKYLYQ
jgi:predicted RNase H-like HicB family nuclease